MMLQSKGWPMPRPPDRVEPTDWQHYDLWRRVRNAIFACPDRFSTLTQIEGLMATDIFTLNTTLAATIEESVVKTLNDLRSVWDPEGDYEAYSFERQPQTFPDVVLRERDNGDNIILGIELKGWYLLAKEEAPTYRFTVTESACNAWDFLVVIPWVLSNVLSGSPVLYCPFVESALYCARKRNYYWIHERNIRDSDGGSINSPQGATPYPSRKTNISDKATKDGGNNFGRLARYGVMDDYIARMRDTSVRGISVRDWQVFFKAHLS